MISIYLEGNVLPVGGLATKPYHIVLGAKQIVVPDSSIYVYHGLNGGYQQAGFDAANAAGKAQQEIHVFNSPDNAVFAKYGVTSTTSDTIVDNSGEIKVHSLNTKYWAYWEGGLRQKPTTTTRPTAAAAFQGMFYLETVSNVDHIYICMQTGVGIYAWKEITGLT